MRPRCQKTPHRTEVSALMAATRLAGKHDTSTLRAYRCKACRAWHLTKQPARALTGIKSTDGMKADTPCKGHAQTVAGIQSGPSTISTDGAGAREGNERGRCAEDVPVRLPDKGSAVGNAAASDVSHPAPSTPKPFGATP